MTTVNEAACIVYRALFTPRRMQHLIEFRWLSRHQLLEEVDVQIEAFFDAAVASSLPANITLNTPLLHMPIFTRYYVSAADSILPLSPCKNDDKFTTY